MVACPRRRILGLLAALCLISACGSAGSRPADQPAAVAQAPDVPLRIYLARHGETDWNVIGKMQGQTDIPLNAVGRAQALLLRDTLKGMTIDAVYSSTLSRSRETAQAIGSSAPLTSLDELREQNRGGFTGAQNDDPEFLKRNANPDDSLDGGESLNQLMARAQVAIDRIRKEHPSGTVVVVGHSVTNQMILRALMNLSAQQATAISQANDELYMIELEPGASARVFKLIRDKNLGDL